MILFLIGIKPTKDTRLVNLSSIESLIMVLAELKHHCVSRDDIQKTFENATYSFMIEERCPFHYEIGISHCSVARCHAGAKLISAYLNQLYVPERPVSTTMTEKYSQNSFANNMSNRVRKSATVRYDKSLTFIHKIVHYMFSLDLQRHLKNFFQVNILHQMKAIQ